MTRNLQRKSTRDIRDDPLPVEDDLKPNEESKDEDNENPPLDINSKLKLKNNPILVPETLKRRRGGSSKRKNEEGKYILYTNNHLS